MPLHIVEDPPVRFLFARDEPKGKLRAHITREAHRKARIRRVQEFQEKKRTVLIYRPRKRRVSFVRSPSPAPLQKTFIRQTAELEVDDWVLQSRNCCFPFCPSLMSTASQDSIEHDQAHLNSTNPQSLIKPSPFHDHPSKHFDIIDSAYRIQLDDCTIFPSPTVLLPTNNSILALYFFSKAQNLDQRALSHPIRDAFFPLGLDDEIAFFATLALTSFQQANFLKQPPGVEAWRLKLKVIRGVNRRLDDPREGISDSAIFSVMAMSRIEVSLPLSCDENRGQWDFFGWLTRLRQAMYSKPTSEPYNT
jgi:hypothetical protein